MPRIFIKLLQKTLKRSGEPFLSKKDYVSKSINAILCSIIGGIVVMLLFEPSTRGLISVEVLFIFFAIMFEYYFFIRYKEWRDAIFNLAIIVMLGVILSFQNDKDVGSRLIDYIFFVSVFSLIFCTMLSKFPTREKEQKLEKSKEERKMESQNN